MNLQNPLITLKDVAENKVFVLLLRNKTYNDLVLIQSNNFWASSFYDEEKDIKPFLDRVLKEGLRSKFMNSEDGIDISERILEESFLKNYDVLLKSNILNFMEDVKNKFLEEFL